MTFLQTFAVAQDARKVLLTVTSNASASQSSAGHALSALQQVELCVHGQPAVADLGAFIALQQVLS